MTYTLGVGIGTYESKGVLVDGSGTVVAQAVSPHEMIVPRPGWAEHRADEDWWKDFTTITRKLLDESGADPSEVGCVALSAIGPCMLPVDRGGRPLMNSVLYGVDTRAAKEIDDLTESIGADRVLSECGNPLTSQAVGPKILWLKRNRPELYEQAHKFLSSTCYLTFRLTGEYVVDHFTAANFIPLYDTANQCWTTELADDICEPERLPRIKWSTEIAGEVTEQAAAETGLAAGTPVTVGTIDAAAEALSVGVREYGDMMMMYGSTVFIIQVTEQRVQDPRLWYAPWMYPGSHITMAGAATSGTLTRWFYRQFARELPDDNAFALLAQEAEASTAGTRDILFLPYFSGERTPIHDPLAKGAFFGLNLTHTRGDMYRALIEGIAHGTAHTIEAIREAGADPRRVLAVGGGTKNRLWLQATSDIGQCTQHVCAKTVGASYGDAFMAACAIGSAEPADIESWNPVVEAVEPVVNPDHARKHELYKRLYIQTKDIAHALGT